MLLTVKDYYSIFTLTDKSKKLFSLFVWDEKNGLPNTIIYQDNDFAPQQPIYQDKRNKFTNYYFQDFKRLQMTGTFFIGIKQFDQDPLNIGFDVNTVTNSKMYYSNSGADWNKSFYQLITDQPGKNTWPISTATFILMHTKQDKPANATEVLKFFNWAFANGGKAASELDYVPMPPDVVATIQKSWGEIKDPAGKAIAFK